MLFKKKLEPQTVEERSSVTMEVELTRPWPEVKWTRNAAALVTGENVEIHAEGSSHRLVLRSVGFADRGFYGCETADDKTQAKLTVESEQLRGLGLGLGIEELGRVGNLPLGAGPWKRGKRERERKGRTSTCRGWGGGEGSKGGSRHPPGGADLPFQSTLRLPGEVMGAGPRARVLLQWLILPLVCPIVRQVRLVRGLQTVEAQEQGTATMEVELSHADVEGSWTRDGLRLQPGPTCQLVVHGPTHTLTLSGLQRQDSGLVSFRAEGVHTSARLMVTGRWTWVGRDSLQSTCPCPQGGPGRQLWAGIWNPGGGRLIPLTS